MKVFLHVIILFGISNILIAQSDSLSDKTAKGTTHDINNDSSYVHIISYPQQSWIERNEGAFISTLLASIVAILSVYLTARSNKKQRLEREMEIYCGLLYSLKIELLYHSRTHENLIQELEVIKHNSLIANELVIHSPSRFINVSFLQEVRSNIINTEIFNTQILLLLSAYIHKCEFVNIDIKLERLDVLLKKFKEKANFSGTTKTYFNIVITHIQELQKAIPPIIEHINADLKSLGKTSDINESEYLKTLANLQLKPTAEVNRDVS